MPEANSPRPLLESALTGAELLRWYWLKDELIEFARILDVSTKGGKDALTPPLFIECNTHQDGSMAGASAHCKRCEHPDTCIVTICAERNRLFRWHPQGSLKPMKILLLGGTAMLGRAIATAAVERGHAVTCLARGSSPAPERTVFVSADRDDVDGLNPVSSETWGAVIDLSRQPGQVRRAVSQLDAQHWVFVSSGNVYADFSHIEQDESAAILAPLTSDVMEDMSTYGEAKVACEQAIRGSGVSATIIRSGLIGGPGDVTGRSGYWPWRFAHPTGDDVIVPDDPDFPCALIDVRDLASWIVLAAEQGLDGTFNATGPTVPLREVIAMARDIAQGSATPRPVAAVTLAELGVSAWMGPASLPLWIDDREWRCFATMNTERARAAGLVTRPFEDTLTAALDYENQRTEPRKAGLTDEEERRVREAPRDPVPPIAGDHGGHE